MTRRTPTPPYRIETPRLVLRCWNPQDAPLLREAIDASDAHLRPWMPWMAKEPRPVAEVAETLRHFRSEFDRDRDFTYAIFDPAETRVVGSTGYHARVRSGGMEIGYWIRADSARQGFATEASAALVRVGFELLDLDRIEIHVEVSNQASAGVPRRLGFVREAVLRRRLEMPDGPRGDSEIWTLFREDHPRRPAAMQPLRAWDAAGAEIAL